MATNRLYAQNNTTMPGLDITGQNHAGGAAVSGEPCVVGKIPGVLATTPGSNGVGTMYRDGIWNLSVKGEGSGGNAAIGEGAILYFDSAKGYLNADDTKVRFGYALQGVGSGSTTTIPVQLGY